MEKFSNIIKEDLSYNTIFGKYVSHEDAIKDKIIYGLIRIIAEVNNISEKDFGMCDKVLNAVNIFLAEHNELIMEGLEYYKNNRRIELLVEVIYDDYKDSIKLN